MNEDFLQETMLFRDMTPEEINHARKTLYAKEKRFQKEQTLLYAGTTTQSLGLVLAGSVRIESNDMWGNRTILAHVEAGNIFAETYALMPEETLLVDVVASEACEILFLNIGSFPALDIQAERWAAKLTANLLSISMQKNLMFSHRSFHTSPKTIRGRVMAYLSSVSMQKKGSEFNIPFNRQQMADYLNLERSALSKELGKMQRDGIIIVKKNHFIIHANDAFL